MYLTEEESNLVYDTCDFDDITEGYLIAVLDELEYPKEKILEAIEKLRFDFTYLGANEIRAIRRGYLASNNIEDPAPADPRPDHTRPSRLPD